MALSAAEKQRRYRQKRDADPERRNSYLQREKTKYKTDKEIGKKKQVKDMSVREHRQKKRQWRKYKQEFKKRQKSTENLLTPPGSPNIPVLPPVRDPQQSGSRQKRQSLRNRSRQKSKLHRKMSVLEKQLELERKRSAMYRKRLQREQVKLEGTPIKKTKTILRSQNTASKKTLRRTLAYHFSLMGQMKHNYKVGKRSIAEVAAGGILKKYKFRQKFVSDVGMFAGSRLRPRCALSLHHAKLIRAFFERDDVSRIIPGQKNTVTRKKLKKQRRVLSDTLINLYTKFQSEHQIHISFTTFWRKKPFWVTYATERDRNTCLCKTCENMKYMADALYKHGVISTSSLNDLVKEVVCSTDNKICMYGECVTCKHCKLKMNVRDQNAPITWSQWKTKKERRILKNGQEKDITLTVKEEQHGSVGNLCDKFYEHLWMLYRRHAFNISNQYKHYKRVRETLMPTQCFIHVDFSENYVGKMTSEIQSMHFGASQSQITLHTGYYIVGGMTHPVSFCGLSDSLQHDPASVWAFLRPVLADIRKSHPSVNSLEFYSDGPTSQYKQKQNFYLFSTEVYKYGFTKATWNFHEAGHGKGIPDGVGAAVKRSADRLVRNGTDILDAQSMMNGLVKAGSSVKLYTIEEHDIKHVETCLDVALKTVAGTMKMHQLITTSPGVFGYRDVSCICFDVPCSSHVLKEVCMLYQEEKKKPESGKGNQNERANRQTRSGRATQMKRNDDQTNVENGDQIPKSDGGQEKMEMRKKKERTNQQPVSTKKTQNQSNRQKKSGKRKPNEGHGEYNSSSKQRKRQQENDSIGENNEGSFTRLLSKLDECSTFEELKIKCEAMQLPEVQGSSRFILHGGFDVDTRAMDMYPIDTPQSQNRYPVIVRADGDCLPACGSVFAYGHDSNTDEMRLRIIHELALNSDYYLDECNLTRGTDGNPKKLKNAFAMYSEEFIPGMRLTDSIIRTIYEHELLKIRKRKSFMGIWQIFALATVLKMPVFSVYPALGNSLLREHIHRLVIPRVQFLTDPGYIMWTSTRTDMRPINWIPNHFVPVLLIGDGPKDDAENVQSGVEENRQSGVEEKRQSGGGEKGQSGGEENGPKDDGEKGQSGGEEKGQSGGEENGQRSGEEKGQSGGEEKGQSGGEENGQRSGEEKGQSGGEENGPKDDGEKGQSGGGEKGPKDDGKKGQSGGEENGPKDDGEKGQSGGEEKGQSGGEENGPKDDGEKGQSGGEENGQRSGEEKGQSGGGEKGQSCGGEKGQSGGEEKGQSGGEEKGQSGGEENGPKDDGEKGQSGGGEKGPKDDGEKGQSGVGEKGQSGGEGKGQSDGEEKGQSGGEEKGQSGGEEKGQSDGEEKGQSGGEENGPKDDGEKGQSGDGENGPKDDGENGQSGCREKGPKDDNEKQLMVDGENERLGNSEQSIYGLLSENVGITDISILLNQYVVVEYDGRPYPGFVTDINDSAVYCECMHHVGRTSNDFYWSRLLKDECWYEYGSIIAIIPKPELIVGSNTHFAVESRLWQKIIDSM